MGVESLTTYDVSGTETVVTAANRLPVEAFLRSTQAKILQASAAQTVTGNGSAVTGLGGYEAAVFELDLTAAATEAGDTLDVFIQTQIDGTNWLDLVHFTQVLGNGGAKRFVSKVVAALAQAEYETGTALGAAAVRHLFGDSYRVRWAIVDVATTGNQSFTFSVTGNFL